MADKLYLSLKGRKQGIIKGGVTEKGREGTIMVYNVAHEIRSPRYAASGLPTGKRMREPITLDGGIIGSDDLETPVALANSTPLLSGKDQ